MLALEKWCLVFIFTTFSPTLLCCLSIWWCWLHYNIIALCSRFPAQKKKSVLYPSSLSLELTELLSLSLSLLFPFSLLIVIFHLCRIWVEWCAGQFGKSLRDQLSAEMELNSLASTLVITCKRCSNYFQFACYFI